MEFSGLSKKKKISDVRFVLGILSHPRRYTEFVFFFYVQHRNKTAHARPNVLWIILRTERPLAAAAAAKIARAPLYIVNRRDRIFAYRMPIAL